MGPAGAGAGAGADVFQGGVDFGPNDDGFVVLLEAPFIIPDDTENPAGLSFELVVVFVDVAAGGDETGAGAGFIEVTGAATGADGYLGVSFALSLLLPPDGMEPR